MPAMGNTTFRDNASIIAKTRGSKLEGLVPTCWAILPTCVFTSSNRPERFDIMPAVRMPLIQSAMVLRTVSIQSPSLAEVVDKSLEKIQEKNNVGQKLHKAPPFIDGWIKTRLGARTFNKTANRRGLSAAAQAAVWNNGLISSIIFSKF